MLLDLIILGVLFMAVVLLVVLILLRHDRKERP